MSRKLSNMRRTLVMSDTADSALRTFAKWASHDDTTYCIHNITCDYKQAFLSEWSIYSETKEDVVK